MSNKNRKIIYGADGNLENTQQESEQKKEKKGFHLPKIPKPVKIVGEVIIGAFAVIGGVGTTSLLIDAVKKPKSEPILPADGKWRDLDTGKVLTEEELAERFN